MRSAPLLLASAMFFVTFLPLTPRAEERECSSPRLVTPDAVNAVWQGTATSGRFKPADGEPGQPAPFGMNIFPVGEAHARGYWRIDGKSATEEDMRGAVAVEGGLINLLGSDHDLYILRLTSLTDEEMSGEICTSPLSFDAETELVGRFEVRKTERPEDFGPQGPP